ncbi:MAG: DUF5132 domain-containing protein [Acetobacteraceae bacterium]|nr:DUF5132 domain-containing protein [Acetobacteraceae bacterium]
MARGFKAGIATGLVLSAGLALLEPLWRPALARWGRPAAKGAVKGGLAAYEIARERLAVLGEKAQDLVAEAEIERATDRPRDGGPASPPSGGS